jgi:hypothetical protein
MIEAGDSHQTPLTRVNGLETGVEVKGKGDGDVVEMVVLLRGGNDLIVTLNEGITDLSPEPGWAAYFFRKVAGGKPKPTTIEVVLRG